MNLSSSQFLVIDDKPIHLDAICNTVNELGGSCLKIDYSQYDEDSIKKKKTIYNGIRVVFSDLHLVTGVSPSDTNAYYSAIAGVLGDIFDRQHPPFLLVLWSEYANDEHKIGLERYLNNPNINVKKPIDILCLSKHDYIDTATGEPISDKNKLQETLKEKIQSNIGINALYEWDYEARKAINETLFELEQLAISQAIATSEDFNNSMLTVLNALAKEAVGLEHLDSNPIQALNLALSPIVQDKLISKSCHSSSFGWAELVNKNTSSLLPKIKDINVVGKYNKLLHLSAYHPNSYKSTDLGVVSTYSDFETIKTEFGFKESEPIFQEFKNSDRTIPNIEPMLISICALCDFAQNKPRSEIFYLAGKIKASDYYKKGNLATREKKFSKLAQNIWQSPVFYYDNCDEAFVIIVNVNRIITGEQLDKSLLNVKFRIKEQLINQLIVHITNHQARPGIVQLF